MLHSLLQFPAEEMTYLELLKKLQTLEKNQLDRQVLVYNEEEDLFYDDGTNLRITDRSVPGFIDADFPYLVV